MEREKNERQNHAFSLLMNFHHSDQCTLFSLEIDPFCSTFVTHVGKRLSGPPDRKGALYSLMPWDLDSDEVGARRSGQYSVVL